jgi:hypothetical protein
LTGKVLGPARFLSQEAVFISNQSFAFFSFAAHGQQFSFFCPPRDSHRRMPPPPVFAGEFSRIAV